jgi:hypothetical protein
MPYTLTNPAPMIPKKRIHGDGVLQSDWLVTAFPSAVEAARNALILKLTVGRQRPLHGVHSFVTKYRSWPEASGCRALDMPWLPLERIRQWGQSVISWSLRYVAIASFSLIQCVSEVRRGCCVRFVEV